MNKEFPLLSQSLRNEINGYVNVNDIVVTIDTHGERFYVDIDQLAKAEKRCEDNRVYLIISGGKPILIGNRSNGWNTSCRFIGNYTIASAEFNEKIGTIEEIANDEKCSNYRSIRIYVDNYTGGASQDNGVFYKTDFLPNYRIENGEVVDCSDEYLHKKVTVKFSL
jgi:hypothetical protein